jgi:hypothetical protein
MTEKHAWFHVVLTTYGAWLYGDHRGFRTRHNREHVEGDYKSPPAPGQYAVREQRSRKSLKQPPVEVPPHLRSVLGMALKEQLENLDSLLIAIAVCGHHTHFLARMPEARVRVNTGAAKRHAWFELRKIGWQGKLWAKRSKAVPIKDRKHQLNVYRYITNHAREGAWVWRWTMPV